MPLGNIVIYLYSFLMVWGERREECSQNQASFSSAFVFQVYYLYVVPKFNQIYILFLQYILGFILEFGDIMNKIEGSCLNRTHILGVEDKQVFSSVLSNKRKSYTKTTTKTQIKLYE